MGWCVVGTFFALTCCLLHNELALVTVAATYFLLERLKYNKSSVQGEMRAHLVQFIRHPS
jgi:hypothetical protein